MKDVSVLIISTSWSICFVDSDSDGLSDEYEESVGMNKDDASDASADTDGDGISNKDEAEAGTDPSSKDSDNDES